MSRIPKAWLPLALLLALAASSCSSGNDRPRPPADGGGGGEGGAGGSGGEGGSEGPTWEEKGATIRSSWETLGDVTLWKKGHFGPEGRAGYVYGGNGIGAIAADGTPLWQLSFEEVEVFQEQILDMQVVRLEEGFDHVLATTMKGDALLVDGSDGSLVWARELPYLEERRAELVLLGEADDPLFFSIFGRAVHSVRTGEVAWEHNLGAPPLYALSLPRGEDQSPLVILTIDRNMDKGEEAPDVFAFTVEGELVFSASSERFVTQLDLLPQEEGNPLLLVGTNDARLVAFSSNGTHQWTRTLVEGGGDTWNAHVDRMLVADVDGDGRNEIFLEIEGIGDGVMLLAMDDEGAETFRVRLDREISLLDWMETPRGPRLVLSFEGFPQVSDVASLDARTGTDRESILGLRAAMGLFRDHDPNKTFVGLVDGRAFFLEDGELMDDHLFVGNSVLVATPRSDEGALAVTQWGIAASVGEQGLGWSRHFDPFERSFPGEAHVVEDQGKTFLAVSGRSSAAQEDPASPGFQFLAEDGERLLSLSTAKEPTAFDLAQLDGEGPKEIVTVHYPIGSAEFCSLAAYETSTKKLAWETELAECLWVWLHPGDADGDGRDEIAVTGFRQGYEAFAALVDGTGALRWQHRFPLLPYWTLVVPGGVVVGGAADDGAGFAAFYDSESGEKLWESRLPLWRDPDDPLETRQGFSYFATAVGTRDDDGFEGIALTTVAGEVYLLDGATGEIRWRAWIREDGTTSTGGGGPIAWVPETEVTPAYLVATEQEGDAVPTTTSLFDLEGNRRGGLASRGGVAAITLREDAEGEWQVALAERFGAKIFAVEAPTEDPSADPLPGD